MRKTTTWVLAALVTAAPGTLQAAQPRPLHTAAAIMEALTAGRHVRAVFRYRDMALVDEKGQPQKAPDAIGVMPLDTVEYFAAGAVGNPEGYFAASHTQLIRHPRHGHVLNYVKVAVYDRGAVKIVAQYLSPTTYEIKMDETFTTTIAAPGGTGAATFYVVE